VQSAANPGGERPAIGQAHIRGARGGIEEGDGIARPHHGRTDPGGFRPVHFTIPPDQAEDLCVYFLNDGANDGGVELLGPRGWWVTRAGVGVDGSVAIDLESADDTGTLTFSIDTAMGSIYSDAWRTFQTGRSSCRRTRRASGL